MNGRMMPLVFFSLALALLSPLLGIRWIDPQAPFSSGLEHDILVNLRLPRSLLAFLAGASLAAGGMVFQALFRNSLATPFTLGVSSGAALGAGLWVVLGFPITLLGIPGASLAAFGGALGSIALVYGLTLARHGTSPGTLLLAGVAVNFFFSSALLAVQASVDLVQSYRIFHWLLGSLQNADLSKSKVLVSFLLPGLGLILWRLRDLDQFLAGEELAQSRGVDAKKVRRDLFVGVSVVVGAAVSVCGPIGFVGLMVPHVARLMVGPEHRRLFPACLALGGGFLATCDAVSRMVAAPAEIPIGVVTALLGGPFFLWLLLQSRDRLF